jgi:hypothetical protein
VPYYERMRLMDAPYYSNFTAVDGANPLTAPNSPFDLRVKDMRCSLYARSRFF